MIFHLDITPAELQEMDATECADLLSDLLTSHGKGYQFVIMNREVSNWISEHMSQGRLTFDRLQLATFKTIKEMHPQHAALLDDGTDADNQPYTHIRIVYGSNSLKICEDGKYFEIGHKEVLSGKYLEQTLFVVESLSADKEFYEHIINKILNREQFFGLPRIHYNCFPGGGDPSYDLCKDKIANGHTVICKIDSDRLCPEKAPNERKQLGKTAKKCDAVFNENCNAKFLFFTIGKSVENYLPKEIVKTIPTKNKKNPHGKRGPRYINYGKLPLFKFLNKTNTQTGHSSRP